MACENCKMNRLCKELDALGYTRCCNTLHPTRKTNADRIRAMSDEELAKQLCKGSCPPDKYKFHCTKIFSGGTTECEKCWLDWLKQEVERDG